MAHHQRMPRSRLENLSDSLSRLGTALDVTLCANLLRHRKTFRPRHGSLSHPTEGLLRLWVVSEILLARDENNRETLAEVEDFGDPLEARETMSAGCSSRARQWQNFEVMVAMTGEMLSFSAPFLVRCRVNLASRWRSR